MSIDHSIQHGFWIICKTSGICFMGLDLGIIFGIRYCDFKKTYMRIFLRLYLVFLSCGGSLIFFLPLKMKKADPSSKKMLLKLDWSQENSFIKAGFTAGIKIIPYQT